jgi:hypothetical protein
MELLSQVCAAREANNVKKKKHKLRGLSLRESCTDRATAACRRKLVPTFADRGVLRGQYNRSLRRYSRFSRPGRATYIGRKREPISLRTRTFVQTRFLYSYVGTLRLSNSPVDEHYSVTESTAAAS